MKEEKDLLIIGNGFDLSAGLRTTYKDFFEDRYDIKLINEINDWVTGKSYDTPKKIIDLPCVNFWDIFFILKYINSKKIVKNWSNIEFDIKAFLINQNNGIFLGKVALKNAILHLSKSDFKYAINSKNRNEQAVIILNLLKSFGDINLIRNNIDEFLNSELLKFEDVFASYIKKQAENNTSYEKRAFMLMASLVSRFSTTSVFTFNYTEIKIKGLLNVENVHGKANQEIIFGIDSKELTHFSKEYKFSKTYRKLLMNVKNNNHMSLPKAITKIKFYGHSLSEADYSYFQSIFDFYSIYNSDVTIQFFFYVFDTDKRKMILDDQLSAITSLFSVYGSTMSNEDHGKNLLHKLILENRIQIIEIDKNGNTISTI